MNETENKRVFKEALKNADKQKPYQQLKQYMWQDLELYQSTSRTLVRGAWFFDFCRVLFKQFTTDKSMPMSDVARFSYKQTLAPKHPWLLRHPCNWAMGLIVNRQEFVGSILKEQSLVLGTAYSEADCYSDFVELTNYCEELSKYIWGYL